MIETLKQPSSFGDWDWKWVAYENILHLRYRLMHMNLNLIKKNISQIRFKLTATIIWRDEFVWFTL